MSVNNDYTERKEIHNRKRKISFYPEVIMTETLHHNNYTMEEKIRCWYNREDYVQIKREFKQTVELMEKKEAGGIPAKQQEEHCFRGLENRMYERSLARKRNRKKSQGAVFKGQEIRRQHLESKKEEEQLMRDETEEEAVATRYNFYSKHCALEAYNMGLLDEAEVFNGEKSKQEKVPKKDYNETRTRRKKPQQQQWVSIFSSTFRRKHCESFEGYSSRAA